MRIGKVLTALAAAGLAGGAAANDSVAERAAGGLVLKHSADIEMASENLYVSAREVRVRYVFRNRAGGDIRTLVAFPLPDRDLAQAEEGDRAWPADFETRVDGEPVAMAVERRAFLGDVEHSALLAELGIPLEPDLLYPALDRLPHAAQERLAALGLVEISSGVERLVSPLWTIRETWHWEQTFPAGRDLLVEHRYTPGAGGTVATALTSRSFRASPEGRAMIARYCIDEAFLAALDRIAARQEQDFPIAETWISYILTTGGNWRAPIGDFRLEVDKGQARNLVSFCGEGVRRISPTRFEMRRSDWRPERDLDVLILSPVGPD